MTLDITCEVKDQSGFWATTESTQTPIGEATDVILVEKRTLVLRERHVRQGPLAIDLTFTDDKVTGKIAMAKSRESKAVDVALGGPLFADAASALPSFAVLPLADGYKVAFRNLELQPVGPKIMQLSVVGSESVTVPAGTFDSWKLEVFPIDKPSEKTTVWIAKAQHKAVKYTSVSQEAGPATVTTELQP